MFLSCEEFRKRIPIRWKQISNYLDLKLTWEDVIAERKKRLKNYIGLFFTIRKSFNWGFDYTENEKIMGKIVSYDTVHFPPFVKNKALFDFFLGHELVHFYRETFGLNILARKVRLLNIFEEAYADTVSTKSLNKKLKLVSGVSGIAEVAMLDEILGSLPRKKIINYAFRPKDKRDAISMFNEVNRLLGKANYRKWIKFYFK